MRIRNIGSSKVVFPSRRGGSTDDNPVRKTDPDPFFLEDDGVVTHRHRVVASKLFYPSRRGGSADNSDAITPLGVEEDSWLPARHRPWRIGKAFIDDEVYVNTCTEDYLFIVTQALWQTPLVAFTDDEILFIQEQLGIEDEVPALAARSASWKLSSAALDDETSWFAEPPPPVEPPAPAQIGRSTGSGGGGAGFSPYHHSSLSRARHAPGVRQIIEQDDEMILKLLMKAVTEGKLNQ